MGAVSKKLVSRFRKAKKQLGDLRRHVAADFGQVPRDVKTVEALVHSGHEPLHAAYVAAQNFTSFFAEAVSQFPEFDPYCQIVGPAQDEYMPSSPPMSPLTMSYFTTWTFFDVRFGPDGETIGTCLLDLAERQQLTVKVGQYLASLGGQPEQLPDSWPRPRAIFLETRVGRLSVTCYGNWLVCRFQEPDLAKTFLPHGPGQRLNSCGMATAEGI